MPHPDRDRLRKVRRFDQLVAYLRDELDWPIDAEDIDEVTYEYTPEELGIDPKNAAKIESIKQLMPLSKDQPWGIFFVKFEKKRLPIVALRRILGQLVIKKRSSSRKSDRPAWRCHDLLFISNYGEGEERQINLAHFAEDTAGGDIPTLKVLGWDGQDTDLHLDHVAGELKSKLRWPGQEEDRDAWRDRWASAFKLRPREVIRTSKDLAVRLATLARAIRRKINGALAIENESGPLRTLMKSFKAALIHDLEDDDFADMYAQTIAYGLLTARVSRPADLVAENVTDMVPITNPFLRELLESFLKLGGRKRGAEGVALDFDELGINDVVETLRAANMEAVLRDFGNRNPQEDPVIHFYQDFLREYDSEMRMKRGVFYTPRPVVSFIVRSVHELLRTEFGLEDGLADSTTWGEMAARNKDLKIPKGAEPKDPFVVVLDPATGTGTFLVEVIEIVFTTMRNKWLAEGRLELEIPNLWNDYVPKHLLPRLHGYELMMAPYAIAHMKIGLKLHETGYRFESDERVRVFLTNALEPTQDFSDTLAFAIPALAHEAESVNSIKRDQRFTVVIGNPPYARHSSNPSRNDDAKLTFIGSLIESYKEGCPELKKPAQAKYLQDDYVKFVRLAESIIVDNGMGAWGFITNHSYLDNPTFRGLRRHLGDSFSKLWFLDLHGSTKKKEVNPDGGKEENVFDIQQGVAIVLSLLLPRALNR